MFKKFSFFIFIILFDVVFSISCSSYDITGKDSNANSPLHNAAINGDISLIKKLINESPDINPENEQCVTPIRIAAYLNEKDIVRLFIERGIDINYRQEDVRSRTTSLFANNILKYPEKKRNFFLTFDAGDDNTNINYILDILNKYHITATFFITGTFMKKYPRDVEKISDQGHIVGNHTYTHAFDYKNEDQLLNELYATECLYKKITGREITRIWRTPYLRHREKPWMLKAARKLGYRHIDVSLFSKDWIPEGENLYLSNDKFINLFKNDMDFHNVSRIDADGTNYLKYRKKSTDYHGIIMLMHTGSFRDNHKDFVYTLEDVILQVISCGYFFDNCRKFED